MAQTSWGALRQTAEDASKPLPEDWYDVQVDKAESTVASTGSPMVKATLNVMSGPQAGNRKVWTQFVFKPDSPFALQMFFKNMGAFGLDAKFFDGLPPEPEAGMGLIANALVGMTARAKIGPREYNGVARDNVIEIGPGQGGARPAAAPNAAGGPPVPGASYVAPPAPQGPPTPGQGAGPAAPPQPVF